jgi:DNA-binding response OmpR family regulator
MRVIVCDDEPTSRAVLSMAVTRLGHDVTVTKDGQEAWEAHRASPAAIIVSDWLMPVMSGVELCRKIREAEVREYTYILLVTSLTDQESCLEGFSAGADDFVTKPVDATQLSARIHAAERTIRKMQERVEHALRDSIELAQDAVGGDDGRLVAPIEALVRIYRQQDAYAKARAFLRRQIDIEQRTLGAEHEKVQRLRATLSELDGKGKPRTQL